MVDLKPQPIPPGLLDDYIKARSMSGAPALISGASAGIDKGLEMTAQVEKVHKARQLAYQINEVKQSPEFEAYNQERGGLPAIAMDSEEGAQKVLADMTDWAKAKSATKAKQEQQKEITLLYDGIKGTSYLPGETGGKGQQVDPNDYLQQGYKVMYKNLATDDNSEYLASKIIGYRKDVVDKFNGDQAVKKYQAAIDAVSAVTGLVEADSPIAHASIPTQMARAMGEVGALSEADKAPFGGSKAYGQRMMQATKNAAKGTLTEDNKKFLREVLGVMKQKSYENKKRLAKLRAAQVAGLPGSKDIYGTKDEIYGYLVPDIVDAEKGTVASRYANVTLEPTQK